MTSNDMLSWSSKLRARHGKVTPSWRRVSPRLLRWRLRARAPRMATWQSPTAEAVGARRMGFRCMLRSKTSQRSRLVLPKQGGRCGIAARINA
eukprot:4463502-Pyramimonas_sp.AAC.1